MITDSNIANKQCSKTLRIRAFSTIRKVVWQGMILTLGISSFIAVLQKAAFAASSTVLSQTESGAIALSSESLRGIEQEDLKDYSNIVSKTKSIPTIKPILLSQNPKGAVIQISPKILDLIKRIDVNTGGSSLDSEELVKVRYRVDLT
jgi:hypothetical protein